MRLVVKVGTQSILDDDGAPFYSVIEQLVKQIARLQQSGHQLIVVSSGAVASGRKMAYQLLQRSYGHSLAEKQALAALGQPELMRVYTEQFSQYKLLVSQLLLTKQDFQTRQNYLNIARLLRMVLDDKYIIPIINENDSVAIEELMFTDNDELAGLIAAQLNADKLIILTNVDGVYTGHPELPGSKHIAVIDSASAWPEVSSLRSKHGRGGMISKLHTARKLSSLGITTHIANINHSNALGEIVAGNSIGTSILPAKRKSSIKRWLAYNNDKRTGSIFINAGLYELLKENKRVLSILPVGIEKCEGDFKRGDLVEIIAINGQKIGFGLARYDAQKLTDYLGQKSKPIFIHYDHLHISMALLNG